MKNSVIKELSTPELIERLEDEKAQYSKIKLNHAVSPLENPMKIRAARKTIARLQTEVSVRNNVNEKQI